MSGSDVLEPGWLARGLESAREEVAACSHMQRLVALAEKEFGITPEVDESIRKTCSLSD